MKGDKQKCKTVFNFLSYFMQISILSITIPPRDTTWRERKPSPQDNYCAQNPPLGTEKGVKISTLGHKVWKFHKYIYKLWHYLKWKTLGSQQIKRFFSEETYY